jgi:hypothetical protein
MPEECAKVMFRESLGSLMAHTLRAVFNHYYRRGIVVDILIIADTANSILSRSPIPNATSMLRTQLSHRRVDGTQHDRVTAWIFVHQDANKHLARICVAHEIYHLVLELNAYIEGQRSAWSQIPVDKHSKIAVTSLHVGFVVTTTGSIAMNIYARSTYTFQRGCSEML